MAVKKYELTLTRSHIEVLLKLLHPYIFSTDQKYKRMIFGSPQKVKDAHFLYEMFTDILIPGAGKCTKSSSL